MFRALACTLTFAIAVIAMPAVAGETDVQTQAAAPAAQGSAKKVTCTSDAAATICGRRRCSTLGLGLILSSRR